MVSSKIIAAVVIIVVIGTLAALFGSGALHSLFGSNCPDIPISVFANTPGYSSVSVPIYGYGSAGGFNVGPASGNTGFYSEQCSITGSSITGSFYNYTVVTFYLGIRGGVPPEQSYSGSLYIAAPTAAAATISAANLNNSAQLSSDYQNLTKFAPGTLGYQTVIGIIDAINGSIWYNDALPGAQQQTMQPPSSTTTISIPASTTSIPATSTIGSAFNVTTTIPPQCNCAKQVPPGTSGGIVGYIDGIISWLKSLLTSNYTV